MTKENLTSINVVIDASGSMAGLTNDTIGSFNSFLTEQQAVPGECDFTLCVFSTDYRLVHDCVRIAGVPALNDKVYRPAGGTALLDALGATVDSVGRRLAALPEEERPSKVLFLVITDGEENSSHRYSTAQIKSMVEHQRSVYSWEFVFIGANIDAFTAGTSLGISGSNSVAYNATKGGTSRLYDSVSSNTTAYRRARSSLAPDFFSQTGITPTSVPSTTTTTTTTTITPVPATPGTGSGTTTK